MYSNIVIIIIMKWNGPTVKHSSRPHDCIIFSLTGSHSLSSFGKADHLHIYLFPLPSQFWFSLLFFLLILLQSTPIPYQVKIIFSISFYLFAGFLYSCIAD